MRVRGKDEEGNDIEARGGRKVNASRCGKMRVWELGEVLGRDLWAYFD